MNATTHWTLEQASHLPLLGSVAAAGSDTGTMHE
jgi:hypothetical protein